MLVNLSLRALILLNCFNAQRFRKLGKLRLLIKRWKDKMQYKACKNGEIKVVQLLLECCNYEESGLNTRDKHGWTPFMYAFLLACLNGHKDIVKILFQLPTTCMDRGLTASLYEFLTPKIANISRRPWRLRRVARFARRFVRRFARPRNLEFFFI